MAFKALQIVGNELFVLCGFRVFAEEKHDVSSIENGQKESAEEQRKAVEMQGIYQIDDTAEEGEIPEDWRNSHPARPLGNYPLHNETASKKNSSQRPEYRPEI